jgi:RNA polymerase sigma factor (sigma-70 family)
MRGRRRGRRIWPQAGDSATQELIRGRAEPRPFEAAVLVRERSAELLGAIAALPERDRVVLQLRFLLDLGEREMAAALGCRPGTVKSRLARALDRLREELET